MLHPGRETAGVGGWLLVLVLLLTVWHPLSLGLVASSVLDKLPVRGLPLALVLMLRMLAVGYGIAAGIAIVGRRAAAVALAKSSLIASAAVDTFVYATPYFPNNRPPGDTTIVLLASLTYYVIWFAYLSRSRRVRNTFA